MKDTVKLLLLAMMLYSSVLAQGISIGAVGGIRSYLSPDEFTQEIIDGGAGLNSGFCYGVKGKISPAGTKLELTIQVTNTHFHSKEMGIDVDQDLFIGGAGFQLSPFTIPGNGKVYFGMDFFYNHIGHIEFSDGRETYTTRYFKRFGIGLGAGAEFPVIQRFYLDFSAKYNFNNLLSKDQGEGDINTSIVALGLMYRIL